MVPCSDLGGQPQVTQVPALMAGPLSMRDKGNSETVYLGLRKRPYLKDSAGHCRLSSTDFLGCILDIITRQKSQLQNAGMVFQKDVPQSLQSQASFRYLTSQPPEVKHAVHFRRKKLECSLSAHTKPNQSSAGLG